MNCCSHPARRVNSPVTISPPTKINSTPVTRITHGGGLYFKMLLVVVVAIALEEMLDMWIFPEKHAMLARS